MLEKSYLKNKNKNKLGLVVHACYFSYSGGRRRILIQGQPGQNSETQFEKQTKAKV
jgi:hypothetical protein